MSSCPKIVSQSRSAPEQLLRCFPAWRFSVIPTGWHVRSNGWGTLAGECEPERKQAFLPCTGVIRTPENSFSVDCPRSTPSLPWLRFANVLTGCISQPAVRCSLYSSPLSWQLIFGRRIGTREYASVSRHWRVFSNAVHRARSLLFKKFPNSFNWNLNSPLLILHQSTS